MSELLSTILKDAVTHTPGAVRSVARRELVATCKEFFRDSYSWRATLDAVDVTASDFTYTATSPVAETIVHQILDVEYKGLPLQGLTDRPRGERGVGTPHSWYSTGTNTFELWPTPETTETLSLIVRVAIVPLDTITELPDDLYRRHYDALLNGLLGRMFGHPAKPYSNLQSAQYHLRRFRDAIGFAAGQAKTGHVNGQNWLFPRFGK